MGNEGKIESNGHDILLIDNDPPTIKLVTAYFQNKGFSCKGVLNGAEAIEELKHSIPKIILVEILLSYMCG